MSILLLRARPIVAFDETNQEHRKMFHEFVEKRTWGHCPFRFMAEGLNTSLVHHISERMLQYYVNEEFKKSKKPKTQGTQNTVRRKQSVSTTKGRNKKEISA